MLIHATCIALNGAAVLLAGPAGAGKSDLALRLIDTGAALVSDDQTFLMRDGENLIASPPDSIQGLIEVRHVGLLRMPFIKAARVALYIDLVAMSDDLERLPEKDEILLLDIPIRRLRLPAFTASTPAKIKAAMKYEMET